MSSNLTFLPGIEPGISLPYFGPVENENIYSIFFLLPGIEPGISGSEIGPNVIQ